MRDRRKLRDAAAVLPLVALMLLMPPLIGLVAGAGVALVYIFGVWSLAILAAALLSGRIARDDESGGGA